MCKMFIRECFQKQPVSVKELGLGKERIYSVESSTETSTNSMGTSEAAVAPRVALNEGREPSLGTSH